MISIDAEWRGLRVHGSYDHEPATGPTFSCGGTPPSTVVEVDRLEPIDDLPDALVELADAGLPGAARVAEGYARIFGELPRRVEDWLLDRFEEEIDEALYEAAREHRIHGDDDYDEDDRYEDDDR